MNTVPALVRDVRVGGNGMNTVPAIFLGCVARHIRHIQCIGNGLSDTNGNDADAHAYREALSTPVELEPSYACPDLLGELKRLVQGRMFHQHCKFVAANARHRVASAHLAFQQCGDLPQQFIPRNMPAGVIDELELIKIQETQDVRVFRGN